MHVIACVTRTARTGPGRVGSGLLKVTNQSIIVEEEEEEEENGVTQQQDGGGKKEERWWHLARKEGKGKER